MFTKNQITEIAEKVIHMDRVTADALLRAAYTAITGDTRPTYRAIVLHALNGDIAHVSATHGYTAFVDAVDSVINVICEKMQGETKK